MKKIFLIILSIFLISQNVAMADVIDKTTIPVGAYIQYKPSKTSYNVPSSNSGYSKEQPYNPSQTTKWQVFKNTDGKLEIISANPISELYLEGETGYTNAVGCLKALSEAYINSTYASSARVLGTTGSSKIYTTDTDEYYKSDMEILRKNKSLHCGKYVWFGSRVKWSWWYSVRTYKDTENDLTSNEMYKGKESSRKSHYVRPIVVLKSNIQICDGEGTSSNPYKLGFGIKYVANEAENVPQMQIKEYGEDIIISDQIPTKDGTTFIEWNTSADGSGTTYLGGTTYSANKSITLYAQWEKVPNKPVIDSGLTPVNYSNGKWVNTTKDNWKYNYDIATANTGTIAGDGTAMWANAKTADESMYVWIPRYTYKIVSGNHESSVVSWSSDLYKSSSTAGKILIRYSDGTTDDTSDGYLSHPAFTFGDDELEGIWVAKFEASRSDAKDNSVGSSATPSSKPSVKSWRNVSVSEAYEYAYNLNRDLDSHLIRNSEWSAVAYLTNAVGRIPYRNNNSNYITGIVGTKETSASSSDKLNTYDTENGVRGSTTHNIYGIYDMSGGANEMVSAYYSSGTNTYLSKDVKSKKYAGILYENSSTKYVEVYDKAYSSSKLGTAMYETSSSSSESTSWDGDMSNGLAADTPVLMRGGAQESSTTQTGIFYFKSVTGVQKDARGFRVALAIVSNEYTVKYDANGGSWAPSSQVKKFGSNLTLDTAEPIYTGYRFIEWNTKSDGSGKAYTSGSIYSEDKNITLYAMWEESEPESEETSIMFSSNFLSNECYTMKTGYVFSNIRVSLDNYWTLDSIVKDGINLTVKEISGNTVSDVSSSAIVRVVNLRNSKNEIQDINEAAYFRPGEYTIGIAIGGANLFTNTSSKYRVILDTFSIRNENVNLDFSTRSGNWFDVIVKDFQNLT